MNRQRLFNYIEEHLFVLAHRVETRGKLNILDLHLHSENFYRDFLNLLYGWKLENLNRVNQNVEAIDLIDKTNKIIIQVSSTNTKQKVESALQKESMANYIGWSFKFISIARPATNLRQNTFSNPHGLNFLPVNDIFDIDSLVREVFGLTIDKLQEIETFIRKELGNDATSMVIESDLTRIITMLAQVDFSAFDQIKLDNDFQIDTKIDYNDLIKSKAVIKEYKIWQNSVSHIYSAFDAEGLNKSLFVLQKIRNFYLEHCCELKGDELLDAVRNDVKTEIRKHAQSGELTEESIDICSDVIVVDAFIRCKIFENPAGYSYVTA
ncbi:MAG: SMEK domain-containing protein [Bacteroidales bacterium]|nr:SMEK domain-containing protein [Bacteroidales bacterium]